MRAIKLNTYRSYFSLVVTFIHIFKSSFNQRLFSFSNVKPGSLLIDTSTIEPAVAQEMAELTQSKGATFLDAPVSGGMLCFSSNV